MRADGAELSQCFKFYEKECLMCYGSRNDTNQRGKMLILPGQDCISCASSLANDGAKVVLHNFANNNIPGGPAQLRANTQEEQLMKRTTLGASIGTSRDDAPLYPIDVLSSGQRSLSLLYSPAVRCVRDVKNTALDKWSAPFSVITIAALASPPTDGDAYKHDADRAITLRKIKMIIGAVEPGATFVGGEWGCGVFGNPHQAIIDLWVKEIDRSGLNAIFCCWNAEFTKKLQTAAKKQRILYHH